MEDYGSHIPSDALAASTLSQFMRAAEIADIEYMRKSFDLTSYRDECLDYIAKKSSSSTGNVERDRCVTRLTLEMNREVFKLMMACREILDRFNRDIDDVAALEN